MTKVPDDLSGLPSFLSSFEERVNSLLQVCRAFDGMRGLNGVTITKSDGEVTVGDGGTGGGVNSPGELEFTEMGNGADAFSTLTSRINWISSFLKKAERMQGDGGVNISISDNRILVSNSGTGGGVNSSAKITKPDIDSAPFFMEWHMESVNKMLRFARAIEQMEGAGGISISVTKNSIIVSKA